MNPQGKPLEAGLSTAVDFAEVTVLNSIFGLMGKFFEGHSGDSQSVVGVFDFSTL